MAIIIQATIIVVDVVLSKWLEADTTVSNAKRNDIHLMLHLAISATVEKSISIGDKNTL